MWFLIHLIFESFLKPLKKSIMSFIWGNKSSLQHLQRPPVINQPPSQNPSTSGEPTWFKTILNSQSPIHPNKCSMFSSRTVLPSWFCLLRSSPLRAFSGLSGQGPIFHLSYILYVAKNLQSIQIHWERSKQRLCHQPISVLPISSVSHKSYRSSP